MPCVLVWYVQDVRRTRAETTAFRDEAVQDWLVHCVTLFCQERGLPYSQVCLASDHRLRQELVKGCAVSRCIEFRSDGTLIWNVQKAKEHGIVESP